MRRRRVAEERAAHAAVVVDASIAVAGFAREPGSQDAARLLQSDRPLMAPDIMRVEAANAWWKKVRHGDMARPDLEQAVGDLLALSISLVPASTLLGRAGRLACEIGHPVHDCLYLVLLQQGGATLATADDRLRQAAVRLSLPLWE